MDRYSVVPTGDTKSGVAAEASDRAGKASVALGGETIFIGGPCSREQAGSWASRAAKKGNGAAEDEAAALAALKAANCYIFLSKAAGDKAMRLNDAIRGRELAEIAVDLLPENALAHYLLAYLSGLEAELAQIRGLALVPVIEREALIAAESGPEIDRGGPDRMLGELYLRAPAFPLSVGDSSKALIHFERAVAQAPENLENRAGVVEALLAEEQYGAACSKIGEILERLPKSDEYEEDTWRRIGSALGRICSKVSD